MAFSVRISRLVFNPEGSETIRFAPDADKIALRVTEVNMLKNCTYLGPKLPRLSLQSSASFWAMMAPTHMQWVSSLLPL